MPGPPMLQGPFRVPSFNGYIPRRLQPWIYLLFAFVEFMGSTPKVLQTALREACFISARLPPMCSTS